MAQQLEDISPERAMTLIKETLSWPASPQSSTALTTMVVNPRGGYRSFTNGRCHQLIITDLSPEGQLQLFCCYRFAERLAMGAATV